MPAVHCVNRHQLQSLVLQIHITSSRAGWISWCMKTLKEIYLKCIKHRSQTYNYLRAKIKLRILSQGCKCNWWQMLCFFSGRLFDSFFTECSSSWHLIRCAPSNTPFVMILSWLLIIKRAFKKRALFTKMTCFFMFCLPYIWCSNGHTNFMRQIISRFGPPCKKIKGPKGPSLTVLLADFVRKPLHKLRIQFCDNDRLVISG